MRCSALSNEAHFFFLQNALAEIGRSRHTVRRLLLCMAPAGVDLEVQGSVIELLFTVFVKTPTGYQCVNMNLG